MFRSLYHVLQNRPINSRIRTQRKIVVQWNRSVEYGGHYSVTSITSHVLKKQKHQYYYNKVDCNLNHSYIKTYFTSFSGCVYILCTGQWSGLLLNGLWECSRLTCVYLVTMVLVVLLMHLLYVFSVGSDADCVHRYADYRGFVKTLCLTIRQKKVIENARMSFSLIVKLIFLF